MIEYIRKMTSDGWRVTHRSDEAVTSTKKKSNGRVIPTHGMGSAATA
jgi:hypothetical protein